MKKALNARDVVDTFNHHNAHATQLLNLYPDLEVVIDGINYEYYSHKICAETDEAEVVKETPSTYVYLYVARPFKKVRLNCPHCDGVVQVNSNPAKIPFLIVHEIIFNKEFIWYSLTYEDLLRINSFHPKSLEVIKKYMLSKLDDHSKAQQKVDLSYLNESIKRLIPFA